LGSGSLALAAAGEGAKVLAKRRKLRPDVSVGASSIGHVRNTPIIASHPPLSIPIVPVASIMVSWKLSSLLLSLSALNAFAAIEVSFRTTYEA
jgi:hypothetical protein